MVNASRAENPSKPATEILSARPPSRPRFHFLDDVAIKNLPPLTWQVENIVPSNSLTVLFAPPEGLKTFFAFALAFSIATGKPFFGRKVKQGPVVYVSSEGHSGLAPRSDAWKHSHEVFGLAGVRFLTEPVQLIDSADPTTFLAALDTLPAPPVAIFIDTLARCMASGDENSARDMGLAIQQLDHIRRSTKAAIVLVHHTRKDGDSERGSTALRGAADCMISLKREGDRITVNCEKQKDAPHFPSFMLELVSVQNSCALVTANSGSAVTSLIPGDLRHSALSILHDTSLEDGLSTSAWLKVSGLKERTFFTVRKWLIANGYVLPPRKRRDPNIITDAGIYAVTANCNLTAKDTACS